MPIDLQTYEYKTVDLTETVKSKDKKGKIITENILKKPKFKVGQMVYRELEHVRDALGKAQPTNQKRMGDYTFDKTARVITQIFYYSGSITFRYYLQGLKNVSYTEKQLMKA
jgi:hypothetical protein